MTTHTAEDLRATILSVLGDIAPDADTTSLDPEASLRQQLDLDSMDFLNFVIGLHKRLGVEIPESDYGRLGSLSGALGYLQARP